MSDPALPTDTEVPDACADPQQDTQAARSEADKAQEEMFTRHAGTMMHKAREWMAPYEIYRDLYPDVRAMAKALAFANMDPAFHEVKRLIRLVDRPQAEPWRSQAVNRLQENMGPEERQKAARNRNRSMPNLFFAFED